MGIEFDSWRLAAGLGLFLFGMHLLEGALKELAGRPFKRFLRSYTEEPWKGAIAGALSTAALQSSSVVSLIVLAFVSSGILTLQSGIGIGFGSNLGTTATGWIVATLGFRLAIDVVALPLIAMGGFGAVWLRRGGKARSVALLAEGLGLMLLGLHFMKSGAVGVAELFNPEALESYPLIVFLLTGFLLTAIIQSSSATVTITLSALYAGLLSLPAAAAVAIGADLGTTITAILGALAGSGAKKRVAASLVLFNGVTDAMAFLLLHPLLYVVTELLSFEDPLYCLVAFHSLFNLLGVCLFLPLVPSVTNMLERCFQRRERELLRYLQVEGEVIPEIALENLNRETCRLIDQAAALNQRISGQLPLGAFYETGADRERVPLFDEGAPDLEVCYTELKRLEAQLLAASLSVQEERLSPADAKRLSGLFAAIRNAVYSTKSMRSTTYDLYAFRDSVSDSYHGYYQHFQNYAYDFYGALESLRGSQLPELRFERLVEIKRLNESTHHELHLQIYQEVARGEHSETEVSTLLNVNRQFYLCHHALLSALADTLLDPARSRDFAALPAEG